MESLREIHNKPHDKVNRMTEENNKLTNNVNELQTEVAKMEEREGQLTKIAERGNTSANCTRSLVKESDMTIREQTVSMFRDSQ